MDNHTPESLKRLLNEVSDRMRAEELAVNRDMEMIDIEAADRKQERWRRFQEAVRPLYEERADILDTLSLLTGMVSPVFEVSGEED